MKRNLFAISLSVMLVIALLFVVAPSVKAEDSNMIIAEANGEYSITKADTILDLNGQAGIKVDIAAGIELEVIDTANTEFDASTAGTLTKTGAGTIAPVTLSGDFRYLMVENEVAEGETVTYSFHPFNLTISAIGLNTIGEDICVRVSFVANNIVRDKMLGDYGIEILTGDNAGEIPANEYYSFEGKNIVHAYYDLDGSLSSDEKLDTTKKLCAYMVVGGEKVVSNYAPEITPRQVLKDLNNSDTVAKATENQKNAINTLAGNAHLADLFTSFTNKDCGHSAKTNATCVAPETCKNCDAEISGALGHTVGTAATCKSPAICSVCSEPYGDPLAHTDSDDANTECDVCNLELSDYVEFDATELVVYKPSGHEYSNKGTVYGRDNVYSAIFNYWTVEAVAKKTAADNIMPAGSGFATWNDVRNNYKEKGYQYVAVDFALSDGAQINVMGAVPPADGLTTSDVVTSGLTFIAGKPLGWASKCASEEQRSYYAVYSNGKEVAVGDTINVGQWYTVVVKLLVDGNKYKDGSAAYASVAFGGGVQSDKEIYFSTVRYYTNDSYKEDFAPDYDEKDATEIVVCKPTDNDYSNEGTIFGRDNVYGATFNGWTVEAVAKNTANDTVKPANSGFTSWDEVRANLIAQGYEYIAIDFALAEGSSINVACSVLPNGTSYGTAYLTFADNSTLAWRKTDYTDDQKAHFTVFSEGKEVQIGDPISAGQWYTVVIKLLTKVDTSGRYSNVGFECGYGKTYFSSVRYYRNDTFKTDFVSAN